MTGFRIFLAIIFVAIAAYTALVVANYGLSLFGVFFGDMAQFAWPGQFNFDFFCMLMLSGLWTAWRHRFSATGMLLGLCALFGGAFFLSAYLIYLSVKTGGDMPALLLGEQRSLT